MNKKIKNGIILSVLTASSLFGDQLSLFEVSPKTYGKQVFSIGLESFQNQNLDTDKTGVKFLKNISIVLSNKATLLKYGYERGELYWRGTANLGFDLDNDGTITGFEVGAGTLNNFNFFYTGLDISAKYNSFNYKTTSTTTSGSSNTATTQEDSDKVSNYDFLGTATIGFPITKKIDIGFLGSYGFGNVNIDKSSINENYKKTVGGVILSYNQYRSITINTKYTYSILNSENDNFNIKEDKVLLTFSWKYNN